MQQTKISTDYAEKVLQGKYAEMLKCSSISFEKILPIRNALHAFLYGRESSQSASTMLRCGRRHRRFTLKKAFYKNFAVFTCKNLCWSLFLIKLQVFSFSCEYCKMFKNICFEEHPRTAASVGGLRSFALYLFMSLRL